MSESRKPKKDLIIANGNSAINRRRLVLLAALVLAAFVYCDKIVPSPDMVPRNLNGIKTSQELSRDGYVYVGQKTFAFQSGNGQAEVKGTLLFFRLKGFSAYRRKFVFGPGTRLKAKKPVGCLFTTIKLTTFPIVSGDEKVLLRSCRRPDTSTKRMLPNPIDLSGQSFEGAGLTSAVLGVGVKSEADGFISGMSWHRLRWWSMDNPDLVLANGAHLATKVCIGAGQQDAGRSPSLTGS